MNNSLSFSRYRLLNSKNSAGQILGFHRFSEKYCRTISVCDVTDNLYSEDEADLHREHKDFVSSEPGSQEVYFERFLRNIRSLPCEDVDLPFLGPYFSGPWSWTEY